MLEDKHISAAMLQTNNDSGVPASAELSPRFTENEVDIIEFRYCIRDLMDLLEVGYIMGVNNVLIFFYFFVTFLRF